MASTGAGYDLSTTTFSPDGQVFQVKYAYKAVEKSGTAIGIRCIDGVVLSVEKSIVSKMLVKGSNRRTSTLAKHAGMAISGIAADARQLTNKGRSEASSYKDFYGDPIPGKVLAERLAGHVHTHTLYWYLRPFGCAALVSTYSDKDPNGPQLYAIEPNGTAYRYFATALGKHKRGASSELEKIDFEKITCREAVKLIAHIIYKLHDDSKDKDFELEMTWVCDESNKRNVLVPADLLEEAITLAKEAKLKAEMDSDSDSESDDE